MPNVFTSLGGRVLWGAVLTAALATAVFAHDYGVQGKVWQIVEVDIRELLMKDVAKQDWDKVQQKMKQSAAAYFDNLPKRTAPGVRQSKTRWIDPSFVLDNDIYGPVKNAQGQYEWKVLFAKGTRANPLSFQRPYDAMLFFDANVKEQVDFVSGAVHRHPGKFLPVEMTGSNPKELADKLNTPVFSATAQMVEKFAITESPSLLYPGAGEHRLELGLTTFAPPFTQAVLDNTWPEGLMPQKGHP